MTYFVASLVIGFFAVFVLVHALLIGGRALPEPHGYQARMRQTTLDSSLILRIIDPWVRLFAAQSPLDKSSKYVDWVKKKLVHAGYPMGFSPQEFIAFCLITAIGGIFVGVYLSGLSGEPQLVLITILALAGFIWPHFWLMESAGQRLVQFDRELPYAIYLVVLSMEAGLTFPLAVRRYVELATQGQSVVREELSLVLAEMDINRTMREALQSMFERMPSEMLRTLVVAVNQAEEMGSPLSGVLRDQVTVIQNRRSQRAEKLASEASVKILAPLMFIFAAVFLVLFNSLIIRAWTEGLF